MKESNPITQPKDHSSVMFLYIFLYLARYSKLTEILEDNCVSRDEDVPSGTASQSQVSLEHPLACSGSF